MILILFVIHVLIALVLVGTVLLQKSEGGALGMGGGGMSGFMTGRSTANLLTRTTAILAAAFFCTSVLLVVLSNRVQSTRSLIDAPPPSTQEMPGSSTPSGAPPAPVPAAPAPAEPSAPLAK